MNPALFNLKATLKGQYRIFVLNEDNTPYDAGFEQGVWHDNLITDGFMNDWAVANKSLTNDTSTGTNNMRGSFAIGTGSGTVRRDSGAITVSLAGTTATASSSFFVAGDVGQDIVWDTGERRKITAFGSGTSVTVSQTGTIAAAQFEVEYTGRTALVNQVQRALTDNGGFTTTLNYSQSLGVFTADLTVSRVATLAANQNLTEWGIFTTGAVTGGLLGIYELFRDGGGSPIAVTIPLGKKVRVDHRLVIRIPFTPQTKKFVIERLDAANINQPVITAATNATPIQITATAHGFATGNEVRVENVAGNTAANGDWIITVVDANNFTLNTSVGSGAYTPGTGKVGRIYTASTTLYDSATVDSDTFQTFEPGQTGVTNSANIRATSGAPTSATTGVSGTNITATSTSLDSYVADSFTRVKRCVIAEASANGSIFSWSWGSNQNGDRTTGYKIILDPDSITKVNTETFAMTYSVSWARL